jgi:hypothetical protein
MKTEITRGAKAPRKSRKGIDITPHKGGRTVRLPGGKVTPAEWEPICKQWQASGLSWSDFVIKFTGGTE